MRLLEFAYLVLGVLGYLWVFTFVVVVCFLIGLDCSDCLFRLTLCAI